SGCTPAFDDNEKNAFINKVTQELYKLLHEVINTLSLNFSITTTK
ncbi:13594_t:CDS:1, partial [Funneliformis mosseae]